MLIQNAKEGKIMKKRRRGWQVGFNVHERYILTMYEMS